MQSKVSSKVGATRNVVVVKKQNQSPPSPEQKHRTTSSKYNILMKLRMFLPNFVVAIFSQKAVFPTHILYLTAALSAVPHGSHQGG